MKRIFRMFFEKWIVSDYDCDLLYLSFRDGYLQLRNLQLNTDMLTGFPVTIKKVVLNQVDLICDWGNIWNNNVELLKIVVDRIDIVIDKDIDSPQFFDAQSSLLEEASGDWPDDVDKGIIGSVLSSLLCRTSLYIKECRIMMNPNNFCLLIENISMKVSNFDEKESLYSCHISKAYGYIDEREVVQMHCADLTLVIGGELKCLQIDIVRVNISAVELDMIKKKNIPGSDSVEKSLGYFLNLKIATILVESDLFQICVLKTLILIGRNSFYIISQECLCSVGNDGALVRVSKPEFFGDQLFQQIYCLFDLAVIDQTSSGNASKRQARNDYHLLRSIEKCKILNFEFSTVFSVLIVELNVDKYLTASLVHAVISNHSVILQVSGFSLSTSNGNLSASDTTIDFCSKQLVSDHTSFQVFKTASVTIDDTSFVEPLSVVFVPKDSTKYSGSVTINKAKLILTADINSKDPQKLTNMSTDLLCVLDDLHLTIRVLNFSCSYSQSSIELHNFCSHFRSDKLWLSSKVAVLNINSVLNVKLDDTVIGVDLAKDQIACAVDRVVVTGDLKSWSHCKGNGQKSTFFTTFDNYILCGSLVLEQTIAPEVIYLKVDTIRVAKLRNQNDFTFSVRNIQANISEHDNVASIEHIYLRLRDLTIGTIHIRIPFDMQERMTLMFCKIMDSFGKMYRQEPIVTILEKGLTADAINGIPIDTAKESEMLDYFAAYTPLKLVVDSSSDLWLEGFIGEQSKFVDIPGDLIAGNHASVSGQTSEDNVIIMERSFIMDADYFSNPIACSSFPWTDCMEPGLKTFRLLDADIVMTIENIGSVRLDTIKCQLDIRDSSIYSLGLLVQSICGKTEAGSAFIHKPDHVPFLTFDLSLYNIKDSVSDEEYDLHINFSKLLINMTSEFLFKIYDLKNVVNASVKQNASRAKKDSLYFSTLL